MDSFKNNEVEEILEEEILDNDEDTKGFLKLIFL